MTGYHRRMKPHHYWLMRLCMAVLPAGVQAGEHAQVEFRDAWIRVAPPSSPVMAGYVTIVNPGRSEARILRIESPAFGAVELHEMRTHDGVMRMRPVPQLSIAPGAMVELAPGGTHLMLSRPAREWHAGDRAELVFVLADGERRSVEFELRPATSGVN